MPKRKRKAKGQYSRIDMLTAYIPFRELMRLKWGFQSKDAAKAAVDRFQRAMGALDRFQRPKRAKP
jgi:hypothetical protein